MSGSIRFLCLLSHPSPLLRCRFFGSLTTVRRLHRRRCSLSSDGSCDHHPLGFSGSGSSPPIIPTVIPLRRFHNHCPRFSTSGSASIHYHPWPEWSEFLRVLSEAGYFSDSPWNSGDENEFAPSFPDELIGPARACLALARDRPNLLSMVSRKDVEVVVENVTPFLFKNGEDSVRKMRHYLNSGAHGTGNTLDMDKATMVDLMRYLLSYVGYYASSENHNQGVTELSVWSLLREITKLSFSTPEFDASGMVQNQFRDRHEQAPRSLQQNITMKRGDWICPRCNFLNFARNIKCLECEEARPKRQLTGGEWECPQCDFYNYGRNTVCLRCDCKRPGGIVLNEFNSGYSNNPELGRRLAENEEKAGRWFSKVSQLESASDASSAIADDDFPEIMPLRKGVNRFVVSTRKTPLERRLADAGNRVETGGYGTGSENKTLETKTSRNLDEILGSSSSATSGSDDKNVSSRQFGSSRASNSDFVPFVPLPADMFAKKPEKLDTEKTQMDLLDNDQSGRKVDSVLDTNQNFGQVESSKLSGEQIDQFETQGEKEKEQEEKSARWFKRVTELHGVSDLDKIPDEDFPDIMPMRKGENRFVVSRKKDRSLTSPAYKRKMAMEQAKDSNFVPFVPFPPGYFAKQKQPETVNHVPEASGKNPAPTAGNNDENFSQVELSKPSSLNPAPSATRKGDSSNNVVGTTEDTKPRSSWNGKSLEGSLVKEPDPLDMSEEAKTERWFRRVADIKNISELSQIPDEDFPSIMPMRKGVNRFVVSKRKTPLERRLASQQHRRNFPATDSDSPVTRDS